MTTMRFEVNVIKHSHVKTAEVGLSSTN